MYCIDDLFDVLEKVVDTRNNLVSNKPDGYVLKDDEVILYFKIVFGVDIAAKALNTIFDLDLEIKESE